MSKWRVGDWEQTQEVVDGKRPPVENGQTWLRHGKDRKDGSSFRIDLEILKGNSSVAEIASAVGCPIERVKSHLSHLQDKKDPAMEPHHLKLKEVAGKISFDVLTNSSSLDHPEDNKWSDEEYKATVEAYLWMRDQEKNSTLYNKAKVNRDLREGPLAARSKPSVEFRMRNISAVLEELCLPWIKGYLPAGNIRGEGKEKIKFHLATAGAYNPEDYAPTDNPVTLDQRVRELKKRIDPSIDPVGNLAPQLTSATISRYVRSTAVKASVLAKADGNCEGCSLPAPFADENDDPFLEVHHLKQLCQGGSDTVTNAVALCPNCHRRCHHAGDRDAFIDTIYLNISRLIRE